MDSAVIESELATAEHNSFRHNFQTWVDSNYGENSRTKTITRTKYSKICRYLMGEDVETDAKFRFWVKSKAFRIVRHELDPSMAILCVPVSLNSGRRQTSLSGFESGHRRAVMGFIDYRQVAVVEDFYSIIRSVHINEKGVHVGQKKTYRAVSGTYAFLPREAVSYFLMSCNHCKLRIQRSNSILAKHGIPPEYYDSGQEDLTDGEGSVSSNDRDYEDDNEAPVRKRIKRERLDYDNMYENGMKFSEHSDAIPALRAESRKEENGSEELKYLPNGKISRVDPNGNQSMIHGVKTENLPYDKSVSTESSRKLNALHSGVQFWSKNNNRAPRRGSGGGRRLSYSPDTDKRLLQWVMDRDKNGLAVSREAIQSQALSLIREECPDFKASSGWVEKFLIRHKLSLPTKANMLENGIARKAAVANGTLPDSAPSPSTATSPENNGKNGKDVIVEDGRKTEQMENNEKEVDLMSIPINRRGPTRKRVIREFKDEEDDEDDGDMEDTDNDCDKAVPENVNPERLKAFNMFVRLFVDENLDRLVPISKQPKDKVIAIIHACQRQFPEFRDRARKRIRTYLKSCRRLKKLKEPLRRTADQISAAPSMSSAQMQEVNNILASACANEADLGEDNKSLTTQPAIPVRPTRPVLTNGRAESPADTGRQSSSSTMTSSDTPPPTRTAVSPKQRLPLSGTVGPESLAAARAKVGAEYKLNPTEVTAIRQLIASYRESAAFLYRSADELEALLPNSTQSSQKAVR